jgi:tetratricopeptide (TPR) repeat protein
MRFFCLPFMPKPFPLMMTALTVAIAPAWGQSSDPGDFFTKGYLACKKAEQAEADGQFGIAINLYKEAETALSSLSRQFPEWNPPMVRFRLDKSNEGLARLKTKVGAAASKSRNEDPTPLLPSEDSVVPQDFPSPAGARSPRNPNLDPIREIQDRLQSLQSEADDLRTKLRSATNEREELTRRYEDSRREAQKASELLQRLQNRADRAEDALMKAEADSAKIADTNKGLQGENDNLKKQLNTARIERDANDELRTQTIDSLNSARKKVETVTQERDQAKKTVSEFPEKIAAIQKVLDRETKEKQDVASKLVKTEENLRKITGERDEARKVSAEYPAKIAALEKKVSKGEEDLKKVTDQRDNALAQLDKIKSTGKQVDKLLADNTSLMAKLSAAEKSLTQVKDDGTKKDEQIVELKKEISNAQKELIGTQTLSTETQKQMGELQGKLEQQAKALASVQADSANSAAERKRLTEENDTLRGVIVREMKENARRDQTKKLVLGELAQLEVKSQNLLKQIDYLGQPVLRLTEQERRLFKAPLVEVGDAEFSIAAPKDPAKQAPVPAPSNPSPQTAAAQSAGDAKPAQEASSGAEMAKLESPVKPGAAPAGAATEQPQAAAADGTPNVPPQLMGVAREAKDYFDRGNYREAEKCYDKILAKAPNNLYALSNLGVVRFRNGKLKLAEESFKKAIAVAPEDAFSHCTLGIIYYGQGKYDEAVEVLTKTLSIQPKNATAHNYLGITASQKGWQDAARKELDTAISLDPGYADAYFNLAVVCATQQPPDKEGAQKNYKQAIELGAEADSALEQLIK